MSTGPGTNRIAHRGAEAGPRIVLTASEIGSYAFCPTAWRLQRDGTVRDPASVGRLDVGSLAHRRIATRALRVHSVDRLRTMMLLIIVGLAVIIVVSTLSAAGLLAP